MTRRIAFLLPLLLALMAASGYSQTVKDVERRVNDYLNAIHRISEASGSEDDSLLTLNAELRGYLLSALPKVRPSLSSPIRVVQGMRITTSIDHRFRVWSWDMLTGGTMHYYGQIAEYESKNGPRAVPFDPPLPEGEDGYGRDCGGQTDTIYTVSTNDGQTYYLALTKVIGSNRDLSQVIRSHTIDHGTLRRQAPLFRTTRKLLGEISIGYDFFTSRDVKLDKDKSEGIHMSADGKTLFIPIVKGHNITSQYLWYVFDGKEFVFQKEAK